MESDGSGQVTLLDGGTISWAPDGSRFAFTVPPWSDDLWQMATADPGGTRVITLGDGENPQWSPDGSRIAFVRDMDLYVVGANGGNLERVATVVSPWAFVWAPDSSRIAFMRAEGTPPTNGAVVFLPEALWVIDLSTLEETQLTPALFDETGGRPAWSPDGTHLTYAGSRLVTAAGEDVLRLEPGATWADAPWSPDGNELALVGADGSIEILDVATDTRRVLISTAGVSHLAWSPNGRQLAYTGHQRSGEAWSVHVVDLLEGRPVEIGPSYSQFPAWQPVVELAFD
jgi:Tol biopolymer transport system component